MKLKKIITLLFIVVNINAQKSEIANYLDDGGLSDVRNIIKTDFSEFFKSHIQVIWEHKINHNFSIEAGLGYLAHNLYQPVFKRDLIKRSSIYEDLGGGLSFMVCPVLYKDGLDSFRFSFPFKIRYHFGQAISYEFLYGFGKQWFLNRKLTFQIGTGLGFNIETSLDDYSYIFDEDLRYDERSVKDDIGLRIIVPVEIRLGFII